MAPLSRRILLLAALCLSVSSPAFAQQLNLMQATCADYSGMSENDRTQLSLWLAGYFAGGAQRPEIDLSRIAAAPAELVALCAKAPQAPLISAESRAVFMPPPAP
ncbi:MAG: HdeA/HdeB family chaperone [Bosea sp. (in: a-proteobacteria)]